MKLIVYSLLFAFIALISSFIEVESNPIVAMQARKRRGSSGGSSSGRRGGSFFGEIRKLFRTEKKKIIKPPKLSREERFREFKNNRIKLQKEKEKEGVGFFTNLKKKLFGRKKK